MIPARPDASTKYLKVVVPVTLPSVTLWIHEADMGLDGSEGENEREVTRVCSYTRAPEDFACSSSK